MKKGLVFAALTAALVLMFSAISSAAVKPVVPRAGTWKGKTAQGLPIEFVVKKGWKHNLNLRGEAAVRAGVASAEFYTRETCTGTFTDGPTITTTGESGHGFPVIRLATDEIDTGNDYGQTRLRSGLPLFQWTHSGGGTTPQGTVTNALVLRGKFLDRRKARGYVSWYKEEHSLAGDFLCNSGKVRWTIRR